MRRKESLTVTHLQQQNLMQNLMLQNRHSLLHPPTQCQLISHSHPAVRGRTGAHCSSSHVNHLVQQARMFLPGGHSLGSWIQFGTRGHESMSHSPMILQQLMAVTVRVTVRLNQIQSPVRYSRDRECRRAMAPIAINHW